MHRSNHPINYKVVSISFAAYEGQDQYVVTLQSPAVTGEVRVTLVELLTNADWYTKLDAEVLQHLQRIGSYETL